jgi:amino acid adenylation domain-containing protein
VAEAACLHQLVEAQAGRSPGAVAVVSEGGSLTYGELEGRANQVAHRLRALGVGPEVVVGVALERSPELVVALLGVLKAGGAYLPLDPGAPPERVGFMWAESGARLLLTQERYRAQLPAEAGPVLCLAADGGRAFAGEPATPPASGVEPENLAYLMYTSGSTGRPKGVMISHRAIVNHLRWRQHFFPLTPSDRGLHKASLGFDDSVWELFEPLLAGARVVLARPGAQADSGYLVRLIAEQQVTTACFVPSLLRLMVEEPEWAQCTSVRRVTTGGEAPSPELLQRCLATLPGASLHNGYGPTEATIAATFWTYQRGADPAAPVPIGRPIDNTQVYLLDRWGQPVPLGAPGELYIGGRGLARGYWGRPGLTAERFVPDPLSGTPGARLYRTGDRARWRADGVLEFLGRVDDQVKIRGNRVEPGEVETVLREHPAVAEAAVLARADEAGGPSLVAYVVPRAAPPPAAHELRSVLQQYLPEHMVPSAIVYLEALPRTPGGKLDRQALPEPADSPPDSGASYVAPRSQTEESIAGIWQSLLKVQRVGIHDNFFMLGGHSLLATQVVARIRASFGIELPLRALFEAPTVGSLALRVEAAERGQPRSEAPPLVRRPREAYRGTATTQT